MNYFLLSVILFGMNNANASQMSSVEVHKKIVDVTLNEQMYDILHDGGEATEKTKLRELFAQEKIPNINDQEGNSAERTPLICAVRYNYLERAKTLIDLGADVNIRDMNGETALVIACREWELSHENAAALIQLLVLHGTSETDNNYCKRRNKYPERVAALEEAIAQRKEYNSKVAKEIVAVQEDLILDVAGIVAEYSFEKVPAETEEKSK